MIIVWLLSCCATLAAGPRARVGLPAVGQPERADRGAEARARSGFTPQGR